MVSTAQKVFDALRPDEIWWENVKVVVGFSTWVSETERSGGGTGFREIPRGSQRRCPVGTRITGLELGWKWSAAWDNTDAASQRRQGNSREPVRALGEGWGGSQTSGQGEVRGGWL